ncbi:MAG: hypothetical protein KJ915_03365 [Candidatus Omnitrophica bacterium]|nr:hypothetical protein [Candidatus Omnitrophota bacterium]
MSVSNFLTRQNLAPVLQVNADFFRGYFKKDVNVEQIESLTKNSFVRLTDQIKEDKKFYDLYNRLNKLGYLAEKETILSLLVMANGMKISVIRLIGCSLADFYAKLKQYGIKDDFFKQTNARDIFIKTGLAELRQDNVLYLEMDKLAYGLSKQLMEALGPKLIVKHKLYDNGQLDKFEGEAYRFTARPNEDVEVTVEYGFITKIKFLSDNTYADKIARIYDKKGKLIECTRKLGVKLKDLKNNMVILELIKKGIIPVGEATGARLAWGKQYTDEDGRKFNLEGKSVSLTINNGVVVRVVLIEHNIDLPLTIVYESATQLPVFSFVSKIADKRMAKFNDHYVLGRLSKQSTLEVGGKTWCTFIDYPNYRVKYFIKQGWVSKVEVYDNKNILVRQKTIHLVYDNQGKVTDFIRNMTLEAIVGLNDHTIDYALVRNWIYIANGKPADMPGSKGMIYLGRIIPEGTEYPIAGKLVVKNGIIISFECELAEIDNFYYAVDLNAQKVLFYFNAMAKDTLEH